MKASQQAIERGVKDCLFVDYKRRSGHFDVTTVASIKEITEKVPIGFLRKVSEAKVGWRFRKFLYLGKGRKGVWSWVVQTPHSPRSQP